MKSKNLRLVWLAMALSGIVIVDPAPVDLMIIILFLIGVFFYGLKLLSPTYPPMVLLYIFLLGNLLSLWNAVDIVRGSRFLIITVYLVLSWLFFIGIVRRFGENGLKKLFSGYIFAALSSSILSILAYFNAIPYSDRFMKFGRATGLFKDPNVFGPFLIPVALYTLYKMEEGQKKRWAILFTILSIGIFLSFSRAAWGSYVVSLVVYFGIKFLRKPRLKVIIRVVTASVILAGVISYVSSLPSVNAMLQVRSGMQGYDSVRFSKQDLAISVAIDHPVGIGPGQSEQVINYATHNSYLRVWLENGLIGAIGFYLFLLVALIKSYRMLVSTKDSLYALALACIVGILINSFVVDTVHWRHVWFILAMPWFTWKVNETEN